MDRHRRTVRLVARRGGAPPTDRRRREGHASLGYRIQERACRPPCARGGGSEGALSFDVWGEKGYSLVEMVTVMAIMSIVLAGLTQVFTSASKADVDMGNRFQAQLDTRLALDKLRRDIHCADDVSPNTPNPWTSQQSTVTLVITKCGGGNVTWCTAAQSGVTSRWVLYRQSSSSTCSSSSPAIKVASYLTTSTPFVGFSHASGTLASVSVSLPVSVNRTGTGTYRLQDTIYLRNSVRT
ncbi:MAG: prepilin-type N-terminal cleavage/methylation domain-containing protein [Actinobacteria bacterium]|nr:MAG: prepilin-type N-terminal cleavage/methylation domain-containing protein [Actinomycetota bacterium]